MEGKFDQAIEYLMKSKDIAKESQHSGSDIACLDGQIGICYYNKGKFD